MKTNDLTPVASTNVDNLNPLNDFIPKEEELEKIKSEGKVKAEKKEERVTKKSVVIKMISTKKGALVTEIAQSIVDQKIDEDYEKNIRVVKLWLSKIGFKVEKDEKSNRYRKAS